MMIAQLIAALFDGEQHTWLKVLEKTQTSSWWGVHDPNRAVDGEQDNAYDPDTTPIQVEVVSSALEVENTSAVCGGTASGTVQLSASSAGAERVEFAINGTKVGTDSSAPFAVSWDSTSVADGPVTITVKASSGSGDTAEDSCSVTVQNGGAGDLLFDDMESGPGAWTPTGLWHLGSSNSCASPAYASPISAWYFGRDSSCDYDAGGQVQGTLTSPVIANISATSTLSFMFWREVESTSSGNYDKTAVEAAEQGSSDWKVLWSLDSKTASAKTWKSSGALSLAEYAGKNIQLRFSFDSVDDYANNFVGWFVDDVRVTP
jgi:hypothetical protein